METQKRKNNGFTITELMVTVVVGVMAILALFAMSFTIQDNLAITTGVLDISEKGRLAINRISRDLREAKSVISSYNAYTTGDSVLILQVPSIDVSGDMVDPDTYFDIMIYTLDPADTSILLRIVDADESVSSRTDSSGAIAKNIDTLLFSSQGTGLSSVADKASIKTVTTRIITGAIPLGLNLQNEIITSASLRNKGN